jgi:hypothetical protein
MKSLDLLYLTTCRDVYGASYVRQYATERVSAEAASLMNHFTNE